MNGDLEISIIDKRTIVICRKSTYSKATEYDNLVTQEPEVDRHIPVGLKSSWKESCRNKNGRAVRTFTAIENRFYPQGSCEDIGRKGGMNEIS